MIHAMATVERDEHRAFDQRALRLAKQRRALRDGEAPASVGTRLTAARKLELDAETVAPAGRLAGRQLRDAPATRYLSDDPLRRLSYGDRGTTGTAPP
jgi:hypothetical protein